MSVDGLNRTVTRLQESLGRERTVMETLLPLRATAQSLEAKLDELQERIPGAVQGACAVEIAGAQRDDRDHRC